MIVFIKNAIPVLTYPIFIFYCLLPSFLFGQSILLSDQSNTIYQYTPSDCNATPLFTLNIAEKISDLTFDASGNLYALTVKGKLYKIDLPTKSANLIYSFLNLQTFNVICCSKSNILYVTGSEGFVYSYDLTTLAEQYLGDLGLIPTGGMLFFQDILHITVQNKQIIKIDLSDFKRNQIVKYNVNNEIQTLFTALSFGSKCERLSAYGSTDDGSIFQMDLNTNKVIFSCKLNISFIGVASQYDFITDRSLRIKAHEVFPTNCDRNTGKIIIHQTGGIGLINYSSDGINFQGDSLLDRIGLGVHVVLVQDENKCSDSIRINMPQKDRPTIVNVNIEESGCLVKGKVSVFATSVNGPLQYVLDMGKVQQASVFDQVDPGSHIVITRDTNGCADTIALVMSESNKLMISKLVVLPATCNSNDGHLSVLLKDIRGPIRYAIDGGLDQSNPDFEGLSVGLHRIRVQDEMGCQLDTIAQIGLGSCPVYIPNAFTPNQDGHNDLFRIFADGNQSIMVMNYQIFGRWGQLIFEAKSFPIHSSDLWWDGTFQGKTIESGVYIYHIELQMSDKSIKTYRGTIAVIY